MVIENVKPAFGGRLKPAFYYEQVNSIIRVLRDHSSLRVIAQHLSAQGFTTPSGKPWDRLRVAAYLKQNDISKGA